MGLKMIVLNGLIVSYFNILVVCAQLQNYSDVSNKLEKNPRFQPVISRYSFETRDLGKWLKNIVEPKLQVTVKDMESYEQRRANIIWEYCAKFDEVLNYKTGKLTEEIVMYKYHALTLGTDVSSCVGNSLSQISALPSILGAAPKLCLKLQNEEIERYITGKLLEMKKKRDIAQDLVKQYKTCFKNKYPDGDCINSVRGEIYSSFPDGYDYKLVKISTKALDYITNMEEAMLAPCTEGEAMRLQIQGSNIVNRVLSCIIARYPHLRPMFENLGKKSLNSSTAIRLSAGTLILSIFVHFIKKSCMEMWSLF